MPSARNAFARFASDFASAYRLGDIEPLERRGGLSHRADAACRSGAGSGGLVLLCLLIGACTGQEFVNGLLQTAYNAGKYVCRQSSGCDVPDDERGPGAPSNRR